MAYNFDVNFDWIGKLPEVYEEGRLRRARRESLADLQSTDPKSLEEAAAKAFRNGDPELGLRLQSSALQRRSLDQRAQSDAQLATWLRDRPQGMAPPGAGPVPGSIPPSEPTPPVNLPLRPPSPFDTAPQGVDPSVFPPQGRQSQNTAPAGEPVAPQGRIRLAQAGGGPIPGLAPPPGSAVGSPPVPGREVSPPASFGPPRMAPQQPTPAPAPAPNFGPMATPDALAARQEAIQAGQALEGMGSKMSTTPQYRAYMEQLRSAMSRLKMSQSDQDYHLSRIQRAQRGLPDWTKADFEAEQKIAPQRYQEAEKLYVEKSKENAQTGPFLASLERLQKIVDDPEFLSGAVAQRYGQAINAISSFANMAGISLKTVPDIGSLRAKVASIVDPKLKTAALLEEFNALTSDALVKRAGSLAKSFSNTDREYFERIFPQLYQTPQGIRRIISDLKDMAEHSKAVSKVARDYMKEYGNSATVYGLEDAIAEYTAKNPLFINPDGSLTPRAEKFEAIINEPAAPSPVAPTGPRPRPASARGGGPTEPPDLSLPYDPLGPRSGRR